MMSSRVYFISYMLLVPFIFLNLFIAIILEGFAKATEDQKIRINDESIEMFSNIWKKYDKNASGMISQSVVTPQTAQQISSSLSKSSKIQILEIQLDGLKANLFILKKTQIVQMQYWVTKVIAVQKSTFMDSIQLMKRLETLALLVKIKGAMETVILIQIVQVSNFQAHTNLLKAIGKMANGLLLSGIIWSMIQRLNL